MNAVTMERERVSTNYIPVKPYKYDKGIRRGDIFMVDLGDEGVLAEQKGVRPCIVLSNNLGNFHGPTVSIVPLTSSTTKAKLPTHVFIDSTKCDLNYDSIALVEQIRTVSKARLMFKITALDEETMKLVDRATLIQLFDKNMLENIGLLN